MRVLFLAYYFPKPTNPTMGTWALGQAQAFRRAGMAVRVRSYNSWFPRILAPFSAGIRRYTDCPAHHNFEGLPVDYPRWPLYPFERINNPMQSRPLLQVRAAWPFVRAGLFRAVEQFRPDIVHVHHTVPNGYLALQIQQRFGVPYVITDHTYLDVDNAARFRDRRKFYHAVTANAAMVVGSSRRMTQAHRRLGVPPERTMTIHNGSDLPLPSATALPRPPELHDKLVVVSVGMFSENKAFPLLVRAFAKVAHKHPHAVFRIIGEGGQRPQIEQAVSETGMQTRITLCGLRQPQHVRQELEWSDVFALVSWNEAWGVVYNEAMAAGKPILCANDGGINDVLVHGENALTVQPHDEAATAAALDQLLADAELRRRLGAAGKELFLSQLTWDANARKFSDLFARAVKSQGVSRVI
jgi:glycosyltransferase involved in cell wall biosynthesis